MESIVKQLQEKNVKQISKIEAEELVKSHELEKEFQTSITDPIKVLKLENDKNLILEVDQKGNYFIRTLNIENVGEFINDRLETYNKMWDGCGCKVYYNEVWKSKKSSSS